jgi:hypothetical protein
MRKSNFREWFNGVAYCALLWFLAHGFADGLGTAKAHPHVLNWVRAVFITLAALIVLARATIALDESESC